MGMTDDTRPLRDITRRHFFKEVGFGVGSVALASLMNERLLAFTPEADQAVAAAAHTIGPHFAPKAKQVIYLFMVDSRPGAIHAVPVDLNKDGKMDLIVVFAQQFEQVVAFMSVTGRPLRSRTTTSTRMAVVAVV